MPRFESVQEESVSRVPQATSCLISARIDFSSTCARATPPAGRGNLLGCGLPCTGSAGSRGGVRCAATGIARRASRENDRPMKSREQGSDLFLGVVMICTTSMDVAFRESGILASISDAGASSSPPLGTGRVQALGEFYAQLPSRLRLHGRIILCHSIGDRSPQ